jgi:hypothetical protein
MFIVPRIVSAVRILDLDDLGAEISQRLGTGRAGDDPSEINDKKTVERGRRILLPWRSVR